jgi:hypothetical protein
VAYVINEHCIDCGACLPGRDDALGSPGGAYPSGPAGTDTPLVAGWTRA